MDDVLNQRRKKWLIEIFKDNKDRVKLLGDAVRLINPKVKGRPSSINPLFSVEPTRGDTVQDYHLEAAVKVTSKIPDVSLYIKDKDILELVLSRAVRMLGKVGTRTIKKAEFPTSTVSRVGISVKGVVRHGVRNIKGGLVAMYESDLAITSTDSKYQSAKRVAYRVEKGVMEGQGVRDGDTLICIDYRNFGANLPPNDSLVVIEEWDDRNYVEINVKLLQASNDREIKLLSFPGDPKEVIEPIVVKDKKMLLKKAGARINIVAVVETILSPRLKI